MGGKTRPAITYLDNLALGHSWKARSPTDVNVYVRA
jgi:hypothetical protein